MMSHKGREDEESSPCENRIHKAFTWGFGKEAPVRFGPGQWCEKKSFNETLRGLRRQLHWSRACAAGRRTWVWSSEPMERREERQPSMEMLVCKLSAGEEEKGRPLGLVSQTAYPTRWASRQAQGPISKIKVNSLKIARHVLYMHIPIYVPPTNTDTHIHKKYTQQKCFTVYSCVYKSFHDSKSLDWWNSEYGLNVKYYLILLNNNKLPSSWIPKISTKEIMKISSGQERKWDRWGHQATEHRHCSIKYHCLGFLLLCILAFLIYSVWHQIPEVLVFSASLSLCSPEEA